jgi:hypothetical protein
MTEYSEQESGGYESEQSGGCASDDPSQQQSGGYSSDDPSQQQGGGYGP